MSWVFLLLRYSLGGVEQPPQFPVVSKGGVLTRRFLGDGDRLYYDGCSMIIVNGKIVAQASQSVLPKTTFRAILTLYLGFLSKMLRLLQRVGPPKTPNFTLTCDTNFHNSCGSGRST